MFRVFGVVWHGVFLDDGIRGWLSVVERTSWSYSYGQVCFGLAGEWWRGGVSAGWRKLEVLLLLGLQPVLNGAKWCVG